MDRGEKTGTLRKVARLIEDVTEKDWAFQQGVKDSGGLNSLAMCPKDVAPLIG